MDISSLSPYGQISALERNRDAAKTEEFERLLKAAQESQEDEKLMLAAKEFEAYFLQVMMREMRNTIQRSDLIPRSRAEEIFESMLDEEIAKNAVKGNGMGLAQMIYNNMSRFTGSALPPAEALNQISEGGNEEL